MTFRGREALLAAMIMAAAAAGSTGVGQERSMPDDVVRQLAPTGTLRVGILMVDYSRCLIRVSAGSPVSFRILPRSLPARPACRPSWSGSRTRHA